MLLGAILASQYQEAPHDAFAVSAGEPETYAAIFSKKRTPADYRVEFCGALLHAVLRGATVSPDAIDRVQRWFDQRESAPLISRSRGDVAAGWINQAAASQRNARFLFFFFALDALFGERFQVEDRIIEGVKRTLSPDWAEKSPWLFELRSELVHGGAASIEEWPRVERYRDHFHSEPSRDIEAMAATSLLKFYE